MDVDMELDPPLTRGNTPPAVPLSTPHDCPCCTCNLDGGNLDAVRREISRLQARATALLNWTNTLAPINRLPRECLLHIFCLASHGSPKACTQTAIVSVCQHWRQIGLGYRYLWNELINPSLPQLNWQIERSHPALLSVTLKQLGSTTQTNAFLQTLKNIQRVERLSLEVQPETTIPSLLQDLMSGRALATNLRVLTLNFRWWPRNIDFPSFFAPNLEEFILIETIFAPFSECLQGWRNLRKLHLMGYLKQIRGHQDWDTFDLETWAKILAPKQQLEDVWLVYPFKRPAMNSVSAGRPRILLPRLTRLTIWDEPSNMLPFLQHLDSPVLRVLDITPDVLLDPARPDALLHEFDRLMRPVAGAIGPVRILETWKAGFDAHSRLFSVAAAPSPAIPQARTSFSSSTPTRGVMEVANVHDSYYSWISKSPSSAALFATVNPTEVRVYECQPVISETRASLRLLAKCRSARTLVVVGATSYFSPALLALYQMTPRQRERTLGSVKRLVLEEAHFGYGVVQYVVGAFVLQGLEEIVITKAQCIRKGHLKLLGQVADKVRWDGSGFRQ